MRILKRILAIVGGLLVLGFGALAIAISYDGSCRLPETIAADAPRMKAVTSRCYGPPDVLKIEEVARPQPQDGELLVKVHAAAVNPLERFAKRPRSLTSRST